MSELVTLGFRIDSSGIVQGVSIGEREFNRLANAADRTTKKVDSVERGFGALKRTLFGFISAGTALKVFQDLTRNTTAAEVSQKRLEGTLRATAHAAGLTADEIEELASEIESTSLVDDEAVKDAAAILMSFRKIHGETFSEAVRLANDLSFVMQGGLSSAALQLGKALSDPVEGIGALSRAGVKLTGEQEAQIKQFMKVNDVVSAQRVIIDGLRASFAGTASGAKGGLSGAIHDAQTAYNELLETIGNGPTGAVLARFYGSLANNLNQIRASLDQSPEGMTRRNQAKALQEITRLEGGIDQARKLGLSTDADERRLQALRTYVGQVNEYFVALKKVEQAEQAAARASGAKATADQQASEARAAAMAKRQEEIKEIKEITDGLAEEAATMGKSSGQARLYELRMLGASRATIELASAQAALIDTFEQLDLSKLPNFGGMVDDYLSGKGLNGRLPGDGQMTSNQRTLRDIRNQLQYGTTDPAIIAQIERARQQGTSPGVDLSPFTGNSGSWDYEPMTEEAQQAAREFEAIWERAAENSQDALADFLFNIGKGLDSAEELFKNFVDTVLRMLAQIAAAEALGGSDGWFAKLVKGFAGGMISGGGSNLPAAPPIDTTVPEIPSISPNVGIMRFNQAVNFNIQAWDGKDVQRVLVAHAPLIVGMVGSAAADVPKYGRGLSGRRV